MNATLLGRGGGWAAARVTPSPRPNLPDSFAYSSPSPPSTPASSSSSSSSSSLPLPPPPSVRATGKGSGGASASAARVVSPMALRRYHERRRRAAAVSRWIASPPAYPPPEEEDEEEEDEDNDEGSGAGYHSCIEASNSDHCPHSGGGGGVHGSNPSSVASRGTDDDDDTHSENGVTPERELARGAHRDILEVLCQLLVTTVDGSSGSGSNIHEGDGRARSPRQHQRRGNPLPSEEVRYDCERCRCRHLRPTRPVDRAAFPSYSKRLRRCLAHAAQAKPAALIRDAPSTFLE